MCYSIEDGGLRCQGHADERLKKAKESGDAERIQKAQHDYGLTIAGIKELEEAGEIELARLNRLERETRLKLARANRLAKSGDDPEKAKRRVLPRKVGKRRDQARNRMTPLWALERYLTDEDNQTRACLAFNPRLPQEFVDTLLGDPEPVVRAGLARNHNLDQETRSVLLRDSDGFVRAQIAGRADVTEAELLHLAGDPDVRVHSAIVHRFNGLTAEVLDRLASSSDEAVRQRVASHHLTTADTLETLTLDPVGKVTWNVSLNGHASQNSLHTLALQSEYGDVRANVAERADTHPLTLQHLGNDDELGVRRRVVRNPSSPPTALERVWNHEAGIDEDDALAIAKHPNTSESVLQSIGEYPVEAGRVARQRLSDN